jgi:luciferase family oxidoreductase group 1
MTTLAMGGGQYPEDRFPEQVQYLVAYLDGTLPAGHPFAGVTVQPAGPTAPEVWLLGSSDYSGALASQLGLRFAFAHFISADGGEAVTRDYGARYQPSRREPAPQSLVCVSAICGETDEEAERLAASIDLRRLNQDKGINAPVPSYEESLRYACNEAERRRVAYNRRRLVLGAPETVRDRLLALQRVFEADELMVITITGYYETRLRSYELLARAFDLY